ncbi:MAG: UDP-glucose 4-epimerase GalE, partial [Bdellovibrionales bacterium RBG_16_40_8]
KISSVVHFAGYAYVGESVQNPLKYYENNVVGTISLLQAMKSEDIKNFVFSSSCSTYGVPDKNPIIEESIQNPINPYGRTKYFVEKILLDLAHAGVIKSISIRYFNAAGADAELEIGEDHSPETHLIPLAINAAFEADTELTVFGTDYTTPDGTCIRDYIHVTDLAEAHVKALESVSAGNDNWRAYNLGTGKGHSVKEVIQVIEKTAGKKMKVKYGSRRPGDPPELVASLGQVRNELGWEPSNSSLANIILTAVQWYEKHTLQRKDEIVVLVYQAYGQDSVVRQTQFSIVSLMSVLKTTSPLRILVYTDNSILFESFFADLIKSQDPRLRIIAVTPLQIQKWQGAIEFVHRVKIEILRDAAEKFIGSIFYADGDTYFKEDPTDLFARVADNTSIMHTAENILSEGADLISKKITKFLRKNTFVIAGEKIQVPASTVMWNAGVLGISHNNKKFFKPVLEFTDQSYGLYPKHVMEQLAFSFYLQAHTEVIGAEKEIGHYWDQKDEYQKEIEKFFLNNNTYEKAYASYKHFQWPQAIVKNKKKNSWLSWLGVNNFV